MTLVARPATDDAQQLVALALDAAAEACAPSGDQHAESAARAAVLDVLRAILSSDAAPASDLLDSMLAGFDPDVLAAL